MVESTSSPAMAPCSAREPKNGPRNVSRSSRMSARGVMLAALSRLILGLRDHIHRELRVAESCDDARDRIPRRSAIGAHVDGIGATVPGVNRVRHGIDVHGLVV